MEALNANIVIGFHAPQDVTLSARCWLVPFAYLLVDLMGNYAKDGGPGEV